MPTAPQPTSSTDCASDVSSSHAPALDHPLLESYCVVKGLQSEGGKKLNGKTCLVVNVDKNDASRVGCLFMHTSSFAAAAEEADPVGRSAVGGSIIPRGPETSDGGRRGGGTPGRRGGSAERRPQPLGRQNRGVGAVAYPSDASDNALISLKPSNLEPLFGVEVKASALGGKGLFATKHYNTGDVIFEERPFVIAAAFEEVDQQVAMLSDSERLALSGLTSVSEKAAEKFPEGWKGSPWIRRFANNCIACEVLATHNNTQAAPSSPPPSGAYNGGGSSSAVTAPPPPPPPSSATTVAVSAMALYPVMCRVNHACLFSPPHMYNARWAWDKARKVQYLTAARPIAAGAEVTTDYISDTMWGEDRVENLASHGITGCVCVACRPTPTVGKRMQLYGAIKERLTTPAVINAIITAAGTMTASPVRSSGRNSPGSSSSSIDRAAPIVIGSREHVEDAVSKFAKMLEEGLAALGDIEKAATDSSDASGYEPLANLKSYLLMNYFQILARLRRLSSAETLSCAEPSPSTPPASPSSAQFITYLMMQTVERVRVLRLAVVGGNPAHPYNDLTRQMRSMI